MAATQATEPQDHPTLRNRRRYVDAFKAIHSLHGSTYYPCSEAEIKSLTSEDFPRFRAPFFGGCLSKEEATTQLERCLLPGMPLSKSAAEALQRLKNMLTWEDHDWGPDLVVRSCLDWDRVFFNRRLKGHIQINWSNEEALRKWCTRLEEWACLGHNLSDDVSWRWGHCRVELNADVLLLLPDSNCRVIRKGDPPVSQFQYMWGIVLHEYCHSYLSILTGHQDIDRDDTAAGYDGHHGKHFQRCIFAVDRRARELLGVGALRDHPGQNGLPIKTYDVENHIVEPKDSRWAELRKAGYHRVVQVCGLSVRRVVLRSQKFLTAK